MNGDLESVFSHNDHIKLKFDGTNQYTAIGAPEYRPTSPFDEAVRCAKLIEQNNPGVPLKLCLSGGLDSECMALAFEKAQVDFTCVIMQFKDDLNSHDTQFAFRICEKRKFKYEVIELDAVDFFESRKFVPYATASRCSSPQFAVHCWLADQIEGIPIFAGNFIFFHHYDVHYNLKANAVRLPAYKEFSMDRYLKLHNRYGVSSFFMYSPELIYSFFYGTRAMNSANYDNTGLVLKYDFKKQIFRDGGFEFESFADRYTKYTGFEKLKDYFEKKYSKPAVFETLFREPLTRFYPEVQKNALLILKNEHTGPVVEVIEEINHEPK